MGNDGFFKGIFLTLKKKIEKNDHVENDEAEVAVAAFGRS